jgi:hypothetical protein
LQKSQRKLQLFILFLTTWSFPTILSK